jgi:AcrR family transcriptional regulator
MPRVIPDNRFESLVETATRVFQEQGYRRTQIADVAARMGLSKGSIYTYVESKEALFDRVLRHADRSKELDLPAELPVATPAAGATLKMVRRRLAEESALPALHAALSRSRTKDARAELEDILGELYVVLARNRVAIKLLDRCAPDYPELAQLWHGATREGALELLSRYLEGSRRRQLRRFDDLAVVARIVLETLVFWAVHRHWDPSPQPVDDAAGKRTVLDFLARALLEDSCHDRA